MTAPQNASTGEVEVDGVGSFTLQIVPRLTGFSNNNDFVAGSFIRFTGFGFTEGAVSVSFGSSTVIDPDTGTGTPFMLIARRTALQGLLTCALAVGAAAAPSVRAAPAEPPLAAPTGPVVLTVGGALRNANRDGRAAFDMAMLEKLPQVSFSTQTPWYPQPRRFTGPLLRDVLAAAGAQGRTIEARALNDYRVQIPLTDSHRYDVIVARLLDDRPMAVRDKGPLFLIYPFDHAPELRNSVFYGRSAWQLTHLELR